MLCAKGALFAAHMGHAPLNRQRLTPALVHGQMPAVRVLRRWLAAKYGLILVTLGVTGALTGLYSPTGVH